MDVKKLTIDASMHAAQNDRLPLRVVVQVLYFEQVRTTAKGPHNSTSQNTSSLTPNEEKDDEEWDQRDLETCKSLRKQMDKMKILETKELHTNQKMAKKNSKNSRSGAQLLPSRSRRIFDRLWGIGKGGNGECKSSETSVSSQSPPTLGPGDSKFSSLSSRHRRHSIS
uniref:NPH3 domain-containing protein n=2 Tax=Opuntia streptacantha TaxID=393608 RepID=A0A7C9DST1_OPUST